MKEQNGELSAAEADKVWQKSQYANWVRYVPSGIYFARTRIGGKLIRRSLKTKTLTVAKLKLGDLEKEERSKLENRERVEEGTAVFHNLVTEYRARLEGNHSIKPRTREYYGERLDAMLKSWPELRELEVRKLKPEDCEHWPAKYVREASPTNFNNTIGVLRAILEIAVERGIPPLQPARRTDSCHLHRDRWDVAMILWIISGASSTYLRSGAGRRAPRALG